VADFFDHYGFSTAFPVIKTADITDNLPSYRIGSSIDWLATKLVANPAIKRITVTIGWYDEEVELHPGSEMRSIQFASNFLHQYFPIVTLWRHHQNNQRYVPSDAVVDNATGRIADCWGTVGNEFDLRIVPNGDMTYPSVSTADIIASKLRTKLLPIEPLGRYKNVAYDWLKQNRHESDPFINTESVNQEYKEQIVPRHPHHIHSELHYPHPVVFIHDTVLNDSEKGLIQSTKFYNKSSQYAYDNLGCVTNLNVNEWPFVAKSGDVVIHTAGEVTDKVRHLDRLSPDLDIEVCTPESFVRRVGNEEEHR
jgi:hypothetical protein